MSKRQLLEAALALPENDRAELAREIIASLDGPPDEGATDDWIAEIERRVREIEQGSVQGIEWAEVEKRISERLRRVKPR